MKLIILLLLLTDVCFGFKEYYTLTKSIRSLGMGGAFYSQSDDEYGLFYNPAGLSQYRGEGQLMLNINTQVGSGTLNALSSLTSLNQASMSQIVSRLQSFQGTPLYFNAGIMPYYLRKNFAFGLLIGDTKAQMGLLGKELDTSIELTAISDSAVVLGYAREVVDDVRIGFNLKGVLRAGGKKTYSILEVAQNSSVSLDPNTLGGVGFGIDFDLGAIYDLPALPFGVLNQVSFTLNNVLASQLSIFRSGGNPPTLSRLFALGLRSVFPGFGAVDNVNVLLDFSNFGLGGESDPDYGARVGSFWKHVNLGVEVPINGWFLVRAGVQQGNLSFGLGIQTQMVKLDFATYGEELDLGPGRLTSRRFALRLALGMGSPSPSPIFAKDATPSEYKGTPPPIKEMEKPAVIEGPSAVPETIAPEEPGADDSRLDELSKSPSDEKSQGTDAAPSSTEEAK